MALDKVVNEIVESARREATALIQSAEKERDEILSEADEQIARMKKAKEKELEEALKRLRRQEISSAELEAKKIVLNKKKEMLDRTFTETLVELLAMPSSEKKRIYRKIVEIGRKTIPRPRVYCAIGEAKLLDGIEGILEVVETEMEPGLILENEDGSIRLDYRFRTILQDLWEKELRRVSDILFG